MFKLSVAALATLAMLACKQDGTKSSASDSVMGHGQNMASMSDSSMIRMEAHMQMMEHLSGDSLKAMLPEHRQMVANMISKFNQEMAGMNMKTDVAWNALVDSLRQDLVHMPEMTSQGLKGMMPAHAARVQRLSAMHRSMM